VFLVVNSKSSNSITVANHYIELRDIPASHVCYVQWNPTIKVGWPKNFRRDVLKPVIDSINERKLGGHIDTVVYSTDLPFALDYRPELKELKIKVPNASRALVSSTSATYLYQLTLGKRAELFGLNNNFYCPPLATGIQRSRAFSSRVHWKPGGQSDTKAGQQYLLSTALGVTFGDGNTVEEIVAYLKRAKQADFTRPQGSFYYMTNGDIRSRVRTPTFEPAVAELKKLGFGAQIQKGLLPFGKENVLGVTCGWARPVINKNVGLVPGALVDNLTSYGACFHMPLAMRGQTLVSHYLKNGAAGASGTVVEPTANPRKFPNASLHVHYARGCNLAESFYQSVQGPYQLLIVGDPLCQPWAKPVTISLKENLQRVVSGKVKLLPQVSSARADITGDNATEMVGYELYLDGHGIGTIQPGE